MINRSTPKNFIHVIIYFQKQGTCSDEQIPCLFHLVNNPHTIWQKVKQTISNILSQITVRCRVINKGIKHEPRSQAEADHETVKLRFSLYFTDSINER